MHALEPGLAVELTLNSPTCIAQLPTAPGQVTETTPYLTGTVIRGGLATLWLRGRHYAELNPAEQQQFRQIFLNDDVTFQHAWPVDSDADGQTWIVPATAWTQKRHEGWLTDIPRPGGGVRDALVAMLNGSIMTDTWRDWDRVDPGFVSESGGRWRGIRIHRRLITRTALNRIDDLRPLHTRRDHRRTIVYLRGPGGGPGFPVTHYRPGDRINEHPKPVGTIWHDDWHWAGSQSWCRSGTDQR